jgi:hypothetical protein
MIRFITFGIAAAMICTGCNKKPVVTSLGDDALPNTAAGVGGSGSGGAQSIDTGRASGSGGTVERPAGTGGAPSAGRDAMQRDAGDGATQGQAGGGGMQNDDDSMQGMPSDGGMQGAATDGAMPDDDDSMQGSAGGGGRAGASGASGAGGMPRAGRSGGGSGGSGGRGMTSGSGGSGGRGMAGGSGGSGGSDMSNAGNAAPSPTAACLTLERCCEMRTGSERTACEDVLEPRNPEMCRGALARFCVPMQPAPQPPAACTMLGVCCAALAETRDREDCQLVVTAADAMVCSAATNGFCMPMQPNPQPSAECTTLGACCDMLDDANDERDCRQVFNARDPVVCAAANIAYCTSRTPEPPAQCTTLAECCMDVDDASDRRDCDAVVQRANANECTTAADRFCTNEPEPQAACTRLAACCGGVSNTGDRQVCEVTAAAQNAQACENETDRFCEVEPPNAMPLPAACATLEPCCDMQSNDDAEAACKEAVQARDAAACTLVTFQYCG